MKKKPSPAAVGRLIHWMLAIAFTMLIARDRDRYLFLAIVWLLEVFIEAFARTRSGGKVIVRRHTRRNPGRGDRPSRAELEYLQHLWQLKPHKRPEC